jgi:hypothetical protein
MVDTTSLRQPDRLYCKCGQRIERKEKGEMLESRGDIMCADCRRVLAGVRYAKYLTVRRADDGRENL